jgi:hypothetical protein
MREALRNDRLRDLPQRVLECDRSVGFGNGVVGLARLPQRDGREHFPVRGEVSQPDRRVGDGGKGGDESGRRALEGNVGDAPGARGLVRAEAVHRAPELGRNDVVVGELIHVLEPLDVASRLARPTKRSICDQCILIPGLLLAFGRAREKTSPGQQTRSYSMIQIIWTLDNDRLSEWTGRTRLARMSMAFGMEDGNRPSSTGRSR